MLHSDELINSKSAPGSSGGEAEWFVYSLRWGKYGPYSMLELLAKAAAGGINPEDLVWTGDQSTWVPAKKCPFLAIHLRTDETPAPVPAAPGEVTSPKPSVYGKIASWVLAVYFLGCLVAFPYYSWQYANQHGFFSWLFLGEVVPAGKSLIWPYYAASSLLEKGWTQEEKENLAHLKRGTTSAQKAIILVEGFAKTGKPTTTDAARVRALLKEAVDESNLVRDDVLAKVHPDYPKMYREKCVGGLVRLLRVLEADRDDSQEITKAERLLNEWEAWLNAHRKELCIPKDMPE